MDQKHKPISRLTVLLAIVAVFPLLISLLIVKGGVPWGGTLQPQDELTLVLLGPWPLLARFYNRYHLRSLAYVSLQACGILIALGVLYSCLTWLNIGRKKLNERNERNIKCFLFTICLLMAVSVYIFTACLSFSAYYTLVNVEEYKDFQFWDPTIHSLGRLHTEKSHSGILKMKNWDKLQIMYECCGWYSYKEWTPRRLPHRQDFPQPEERKRINHVPDSCCREYFTGCGKNISVENIYQTGCRRNFTEHVGRQVRIQTTQQQIFYLLVSIALIIGAIMIMYYSIKEFCRPCQCCTKRNYRYVPLHDDDVNEPNVAVRKCVKGDADDKVLIEISINQKKQ